MLSKIKKISKNNHNAIGITSSLIRSSLVRFISSNHLLDNFQTTESIRLIILSSSLTFIMGVEISNNLKNHYEEEINNEITI